MRRDAKRCLHHSCTKMAWVSQLDLSALTGLKQTADAQYFDIETVKEWFRLIENGVPEDVALKRLQEEVNSPDSPEAYKGCYRECGGASAFGTLTEAEYKVIMMYCTEGKRFYLRLNEDCRKRLWKKYVVYTSLLHSVCIKLRNMEMDGNVQKNPMYRGIRCEFFTSSNAEFGWPGFTSTSTDKRIAEKFGDAIITMKSETGAPVRRFSEFFECEILFSPFFIFKAERAQSSIIYRNLPDKSDYFISFPFYRGAMLGAVVGNCLAVPFEFKEESTIEALLKVFHDLEESKDKGTLRYNCDVSTTFALAESLIKKNGFNMRHMIDSLSDEYLKDPRRNYGPSLPAVLTELKNKGPQDDVYAPARNQFGGSGSHRNGGAMRVTPAALHFYKLPEIQFKNKLRDITRLTHAHVNGINGAILQATAVQSALCFALEGAWGKDIREEFIAYLLQMMANVENTQNLSQAVYTTKLKKIQGYLKAPPTSKQVQSDLGNGMAAAESVPTAIYCFLRGIQPIHSIPEKYNAFERTIIYAISLGGDTDTIASMAGAIAGAYYGQDAVTQRWRDLCETKAIDDAKRYAKEIHNIVWK